MPRQERRPLRDGVVLLGGERPVPTEVLNFPQLENHPEPAPANLHHADFTGTERRGG